MPAESEKQRKFMAMCHHSPEHARGKCPDMTAEQYEEFETKKAEEPGHYPYSNAEGHSFKPVRHQTGCAHCGFARGEHAAKNPRLKLGGGLRAPIGESVKSLTVLPVRLVGPVFITDMLLKASTLAGRMGTTRSGKMMYGPEHPVYTSPDRPGLRSGNQAPRMVARRLGFHHWGAQDHKDAATQHRHRAHWFEQAWGSKIREAHHRTFGKDWDHADYKVSGIGSDAYHDHDKDALRRLAHGRTAHLTAASTHDHAATIAGRMGRRAGMRKSNGRKPEYMAGTSIPEHLKKLDAWKHQGDWHPASGGTEQPFKARSGARLQYMHQPRTGKHAYLNLDTDLIMTDEEARQHLGKSHFRAQEEKLVKQHTCADCGAGVKASMGMGKQVRAVGGTRGTNLCPTCIGKRRAKMAVGKAEAPPKKKGAPPCAKCGASFMEHMQSALMTHGYKYSKPKTPTQPVAQKSLWDGLLQKALSELTPGLDPEHGPVKVAAAKIPPAKAPWACPHCDTKVGAVHGARAAVQHLRTHGAAGQKTLHQQFQKMKWQTEEGGFTQWAPKRKSLAKAEPGAYGGKTTGPRSVKSYKCTHCGHTSQETTNHWGEIYSKCENCSWKRPGQATVKESVQGPPPGYSKPTPWKTLRVAQMFGAPALATAAKSLWDTLYKAAVTGTPPAPKMTATPQMSAPTPPKMPGAPKVPKMKKPKAPKANKPGWQTGSSAYGNNMTLPSTSSWAKSYALQKAATRAHFRQLADAFVTAHKEAKSVGGAQGFEEQQGVRHAMSHVMGALRTMNPRFDHDKFVTHVLAGGGKTSGGGARGGLSRQHYQKIADAFASAHASVLGGGRPGVHRAQGHVSAALHAMNPRFKPERFEAHVAKRTGGGGQAMLTRSLGQDRVAAWHSNYKSDDMGPVSSRGEKHWDCPTCNNRYVASATAEIAHHKKQHGEAYAAWRAGGGRDSPRVKGWRRPKPRPGPLRPPEAWPQKSERLSLDEQLEKARQGRIYVIPKGANYGRLYKLKPDADKGAAIAKLRESGHTVHDNAPSHATVARQATQGYGKTPDGCRVEADGTCSHGHQSWMRMYGMI